MASFTLEQVLMVSGGQLLVAGPRRQFAGVSTDSRTLQDGELFVAVRGERFNGHDFLDQALEKGAAGALVEEAVPGVRPRNTAYGDWSVIQVTDTIYALGRLAQFHRKRFDIPVIGITGSAGKTTTKEMAAAILGRSRPVLKSEGNFNNEIGLPLTLLSLCETHRAAVLEFAMRGRGQIGYLTALARPTVGIITNIGLTHLELLGSRQEIALAKAELLDEMSARAVAILPKRDEFFSLLLAHAPGPVVTVGEDESCDVWVSKILVGKDGCARFTLRTSRDSFPIRLCCPGRHQVANAVAAAAAALAVGATPKEAQEGLARYQPAKGRMEVRQAPSGCTVVDDSYNANPAAMRAALELLAEMSGGRKVAILGDMLELGPEGPALHREIGRYAMELGLDSLIAVGTLGQEYVAGARDSRAQWRPDHAAAAQAALAVLGPGDVALVKGSRAMQMEQIVEALLKEGPSVQC